MVIERGSTTGDRQQAFEEQGFVVEEGLLSEDEADHYRDLLLETSGLSPSEWDGDGWAATDGINQNEDFWPLLFHNKLDDRLEEVFGGCQPRFTQHADLNVHRAGVGWHRDSAHRDFGRGADWNEELGTYRTARVAIYLQEYEESHCALGLVPGSHKHSRNLTTPEVYTWGGIRLAMKKLREVTGRESADLPVQARIQGVPEDQGFLRPPSDPVWVRTEPGDAIIFDPRLVHASTPNQGPKYSMFVGFGVDNQHSRNLRRYYLEERDDLDYEELAPDLVDRLRKEDMYLELDEENAHRRR